MHNYASTAATLYIVSHNTNHSTTTLNTLLNIVGKTADIILIQEAKIKDPQYATTHPDFILILPPHREHPIIRMATYVSRLDPHICITPRLDISGDPDLQVLEVQTDLIPTLYILNIYNESDPQTKLHTIPYTLTPLSLPIRCIITGNLNAHYPLWNSRVRRQTRANELITLIEGYR
jgi:hypothetical protein